MSDPLAFVWTHLRRRLERAGVDGADLRRLVRVDQQALEAGGDGQALARFELSFRQGDLTVELNASDGEPLSWAFPTLADGDGPPPDPAQALRLAQAAANLPAGAVLAHADYESMGGRRIFVAHWEHREDGVLVEHDYVRVLLSGESHRVFAVYRRWHAVDFQATER